MSEDNSHYSAIAESGGVYSCLICGSSSTSQDDLISMGCGRNCSAAWTVIRSKHTEIARLKAELLKSERLHDGMSTAYRHWKRKSQKATRERDEARLREARQQAAKATLMAKLSILAREGDVRVREWVEDADVASLSVRMEDLVRVQLNSPDQEPEIPRTSSMLEECRAAVGSPSPDQEGDE